MRPLELTVRGFQSYADEHTFDFRDRRLLGVVGPIGSGKSSLLDSIAFALYGKTPRAGRSVRDVINQRGGSAHVELWFEVEGETWRAVRAIRRKGQSAHNLYLHASADPESERLDEVSGASEVTSRVEELLGLSFDAFNRSVFLAQNRFADFLQATASQRDAVLKGVFAFDRLDEMAEAAKQKRDGLRAELADLERFRAEIEDDRRNLGEARPALEAITERLAQLDGSAEQAAELEGAVEAGRRDVERAQRRRSELSDIAAQLPAREQSAELLERATMGAARLAEAETARAAAQSDLANARRHDAEVTKDTGGHELILEATQLSDRLAEVGARLEASDVELSQASAHAEEARRRLEESQARAGLLQTAITSAETTVEDAARGLQLAEVALHDARHNSMAVALRKELTDGSTCPVCDQAVASAPAVLAGEPLDEAEQVVVAARRQHEAAVAAHTEAVAAGAGIAAEIEARAAAMGEAEARASAVTESRAELVESQKVAAGALGALIPGDDVVAELAARRQGIEESAALVAVAAAAEESARVALEEARSQVGTLGTELVQLATTVATLAGQLGGDLRPAAEPAELSDSLTLLRKLWDEATAASTREEKQAAEAVSAALSSLSQLTASLGLSAEQTIAQARQEAAAEQGRLGERVEALATRIERFEELEASSADTVARLATFTTLADDLLPSRFLKFILDEERRGLAALGSEHFERMTRGRYRFTEDGEFDVIDLTAAETERKAESLSGGETFLASLSLALALAEMVSRTGGRLDAFFLDEGFGSLDPEHLDLAMEGIEALVGGNRLVAVVSHVPELRDRVEDLIELDTDPVTGETVVVRA